MSSKILISAYSIQSCGTCLFILFSGIGMTSHWTLGLSLKLTTEIFSIFVNFQLMIKICLIFLSIAFLLTSCVPVDIKFYRKLRTEKIVPMEQ